ncbi:uncharacterized protein LOC129571796, partial [Sitodiplosis mosellana]|uniref:uncharacterized protein LOC129571796 n=1 Tax=Sitodiplosis mosellana TaxID=263140 RepID=UPI0024453227
MMTKKTSSQSAKFARRQTRHTAEHLEYLNKKNEKKLPKRKVHCSKLPLSQSQYEDALLNLIVQGMLPTSIVSLDAFKRYTHEITTGVIEPSYEVPHYNVISAYTVNSRLDDLYKQEIAQIKKEFESVKYFCATADIWSTKRKSFMGVTVHWVDEVTLERKSRVLCCRRFISPHDAEAIAAMLSSIYTEFDISDKVLCTVTDNA